MSEYQILLLPRDNYWDWVAAAKPYVLQFGANLTPDPDSAARYMMPQQVITIAGCSTGYPAEGDIRAWFRKNYPSLRIDCVPAETPEEFMAALQARIDANDRYLLAGADFKLLWPTDYAVVTQAFGASPEIYRRWNLPGHEGIDIRAPRGTKVYACADGKVARVDTYDGDPAKQPYGNSVRLQHRDGYLTVYAHLQTVLVKLGAVVTAGQPIALADSTGNSSADHLHLTLKKAGATAAGLTNYPHDIIDPTPFLEWPSEAAPGPQPPPALTYPWPPGVCLVGVNGRADGRLQPADDEAVKQARLEAVKLNSTAAPEDVDRLRAINPDMFIMVRLYASLRGRNYAAAQFAQDLAFDTLQFYTRGVRYFEIHNEPNLVDEGWTTSWQNGREFGRWWLEVRDQLKVQCPEAKFGYPGLSPDGFPMPLRTNDMRFLSESDAAAQAADWIGLHCYWTDEPEMNSPGGGLGYLEYRRLFPDKLLFITEFSNPAQGVEARLKGQQYVRYYNNLRNAPGLGAAFSFVLSASSNFPWEAWRAEDGKLSEIVSVVGRRDT